MKSLIHHLNHSQSKRLLIIDEGGKLKADQLLHLHDIRDQTRESTGLIVTGPEYFKRNLMALNQAEKDGFPELYSRIEQWIVLDPPTVNEQAQYCSYRGVKNRKLISSICKTGQDFRKLKAVVDTLAMLAIRYLYEQNQSSISQA